MPRSLNVCVQILLGWLTATHSVTRVVVAEDVAVDARSEPQVEAAHLTQIHSVAVGEEQRVLGALAALDEDAGDQVAARSPREEALHLAFVSLRVLPFRPVR